jgi:hypothetical protein
MATADESGSKKRGTRKTGQGWRTPKLTDAQKRLNRAMNFGKKTTIRAGEVPF